MASVWRAVSIPSQPLLKVAQPLEAGIDGSHAILLPGYVLFVFIAYHGASLLSGAAQTATLIRRGQIWPERELVATIAPLFTMAGKGECHCDLQPVPGTFLLTLVDTQAATGLFGLALTLSLGFFAIYNAYFEYLLARTASIDNITRLSHFLTRAFGGALILALACVPVTFALAILIPRSCGRNCLVWFRSSAIWLHRWCC